MRRAVEWTPAETLPMQHQHGALLAHRESSAVRLPAPRSALASAILQVWGAASAAGVTCHLIQKHLCLMHLRRGTRSLCQRPHLVAPPHLRRPHGPQPCQEHQSIAYQNQRPVLGERAPTQGISKGTSRHPRPRSLEVRWIVAAQHRQRAPHETHRPYAHHHKHLQPASARNLRPQMIWQSHPCVIPRAPMAPWRKRIQCR